MALKELVERVVEEAKMLPGLRSSKAEKEKENSTFEDLLATAILNKVIFPKIQNNKKFSHHFQSKIIFKKTFSFNR